MKSYKEFFFFFKLVANDLSDIKILSPVPLGLSAPDLWLYTLLNHERMCIKSEVEEILFKLATNDHSYEAFLLT